MDGKKLVCVEEEAAESVSYSSNGQEGDSNSFRFVPTAAARSNIADRVWSKPPVGFLKVNIDASPSLEHVGIDAVCRDSDGHFIAAKTWQIPGRVEALHGEVLALREVLSWIKDKSWSQVILESDSLLVINALNSNLLQDESSFELIIQRLDLLVEIDRAVLFIGL